MDTKTMIKKLHVFLDFSFMTNVHQGRSIELPNYWYKRDVEQCPDSHTNRGKEQNRSKLSTT